MKKICLIGGGNITHLRHIPGLQRTGRAEVTGIIGAEAGAVEKTARRLGTRNSLVIDPQQPYREQIERLPWFREAEAVVIGTPPRTHHPIAIACLEAGKHVLTEKPMTMNPGEAEELIGVARENNRILSVMHNFQFANGARKLEALMKGGELGKVVSFYQVQFTTRNRRLPRWYKDLPLGLFYDEAAHFFYLLRRLGGPVEVLDAFGHFGPDPADRTPMLMNVEMRAGAIPVHLSINFNAPICEWLFIVSGEKQLAVYDFFRDILTVLPNDGQHYAADILRTSGIMTLGHWTGFVANGLRLVAGRLFYGVDVVMNRFLESLDRGVADADISGERGLETVRAMNRVAEVVAQRHARGGGEGDVPTAVKVSA